MILHETASLSLNKSKWNTNTCFRKIMARRIGMARKSTPPKFEPRSSGYWLIDGCWSQLCSNGARGSVARNILYRLSWRERLTTFHPSMTNVLARWMFVWHVTNLVVTAVYTFVSTAATKFHATSSKFRVGGVWSPAFFFPCSPCNHIILYIYIYKRWPPWGHHHDQARRTNQGFFIHPIRSIRKEPLQP